jgi:type IV pilus assembly protein PilC
MGSFSYQCLNRTGETVNGQMTADDITAAIQRLRATGLYIIELSEIHTSTKKEFFVFKKKITLTDLSLFCRQLSSMIRVGIPITRALNTLSTQIKNKDFKNVLDNIIKNVESGMSLTDAFSVYPLVFSDLFVSMIHAGELGGLLDEALLRLSEQLQRDKALRDNIKSATAYPRTILSFAVVLMVAMVIFLVPTFKKMIPDTVKVPFITKFLFDMSDSLRHFWYIWIICLVALVFGFYQFFKSSIFKRFWDRLKFRLPVFGQLIQKSMVARFSRTLATLLEGGIPVIQALESAGPTSGSMMVADAVKVACRRIEEGRNIADPLEESKVFPPMVIQMISIGEETGSLSLLLVRISEFYEEEVAIISKGLSALIEPIVLVSVGIVVGIMMISLYLPIFLSVTSVGG